MDSRTCSDTPSTSDQRWLNIVNSQQLRQFLREILPDFLKVVDPLESGVLDHLMSAQLLTDTDHESMSGKDVCTRKEQARKLWVFLNKMTVSDFQTTVAPVLLTTFPHIIPVAFVTSQPVDLASLEEGRECFKHSMMARVRASTMADQLYHHGCLSLEDYEDIVSEEFDKDLVWDRMLDSCTGLAQPDTRQLVDGLRTMLARYNLQPPEDLERLVSRGFPCHCAKGVPAVLPSASPFPTRRVGSWVKKSPFGCSTPRSSGSSHTRVDLKSYSGATSCHDSQSLVSEDPLVPDHTTSKPSHSAVHVSTLGAVEEEEESTPMMTPKMPEAMAITMPGVIASPTNTETNHASMGFQNSTLVGSCSDLPVQSTEKTRSAYNVETSPKECGLLHTAILSDSTSTPRLKSPGNTQKNDTTTVSNDTSCGEKEPHSPVESEPLVKRFSFHDITSCPFFDIKFVVGMTIIASVIVSLALIILVESESGPQRYHAMKQLGDAIINLREIALIHNEQIENIENFLRATFNGHWGK